MQRLNLHDTLERHAFDHAVICTFTFEPRFFEGHCLERFRSLAVNNNVTVIVDRRTYEQLVQEPPSQWPRHANVHYLLHPIRVPGTFHPKLFLFATKEKGLLIVGSANFTRAGLTTNAELVGLYRYERGKREQHLGLFRQAMKFLEEIARRWPSPDLESNLRDLLHDAQWLAPESVEPPGPLRLVHNLDRPLWAQIHERLATPVDTVHILSRYFDAEPSTLTRIIEDVKPKKIVLWTENGLTTMTRAWFRHPAMIDRIASVRDCTVLDEDHRQPLHAKAVALVRGRSVRLAFGSANFTASGLFSTSTQANVEIMVIADGLPLTSCDPRRLFDPSGTAKDLVDAGQLRTAPRDPLLLPGAKLPIELHEASLSERRLTCRCTVLADLPESAEVRAVLTSSDGGESRFRLTSIGQALMGELDDTADRRCAEGTTVIHVEAVGKSEPPLLSNRVLLVNLKDIESGRSRGRERRIREAQRSAAQFAAVLNELLQLGETDALKTFLTYCDIPLINAGHPYVLRGARPQSEGTDVWRTLGDRNLRAYASLHDAALGFCDRHLHRMRRHCDRASIRGIPNFMHIALAIGNVLRAQVERALGGLETTRFPLTIEEWHEHRQRLEKYLTTFREVVEILYDEYVPALEERFKATSVREAIRPDLEPLTELCMTFLQVRDRVDSCLRSTLRVQLPRGDLIVPRIFPNDLLSDSRWSDWSGSVRTYVNRSVAWLRATA